MEVDRVATRLRSLGLARLGAPLTPGGPSVAEAAYGLAGRLAALSESVEAAAAGRSGGVRDLPVLAPHAVGDQVAVVGHDLLVALADPHTPPALVGRVGSEALAAVRDLRRALP